ncbi:MAG: RNA-directed DNA polymerase [Actinomycetota bacterium]
MAASFQHVPMTSGGMRSLVRLSGRHDLTYRSVVADLAPTIVARSGPETFANRPSERRDGALVPAPWGPVRQRFRRRVHMLARAAGSVAVSDIRDCYRSIAPSILEDCLRDLALDPRPLLRVLASTERLGLRGLPVGPYPSALLAEAVLGRIDRAMRAPGIRHVRWVDDVVITGRSPRDVRSALRRFEEAAGDLGLDISRSKTRVLTAGDRRRVCEGVGESYAPRPRMRA